MDGNVTPEDWTEMQKEMRKLMLHEPRPQIGSPLVPSGPEACVVFNKLLEDCPGSDMRAVPNEWLLRERARTRRIADELEAKIKDLEAQLAEKNKLLRECKKVMKADNLHKGNPDRRGLWSRLNKALAGGEE